MQHLVELEPRICMYLNAAALAFDVNCVDKEFIAVVRKLVE